MRCCHSVKRRPIEPVNALLAAICSNRILQRQSTVETMLSCRVAAQYCLSLVVPRVHIDIERPQT